MSSSCSHLLAEYKKCVRNSLCVTRDGKLPSECRDTPTCKAFREAVFRCKMGMLDMRKRFRGNNVDIPPPKSQEQTSSNSA